MENAGKLLPLAKELAQVLAENDVTRLLTRKQQFEFAMNSDFQLLIKNNTAPVSEIPAEEEEDAKRDDGASSEIIDDAVIS